MSDSKHISYSVLLFLCVLTVGGGLLIWPTYREVRDMRHDIADLNHRVRTLDVMEELVVKLKARLDEANHMIDYEMKVIPEVAGVAELMRGLSLRVDRMIVYDQTFTAGSPTEALNDEEATVRAIPLMIDMEGAFDSVFAVIQAAESMERLIRITSVRLNCERERVTGQGDPYVVASIGLDAIFDPGVRKED